MPADRPAIVVLAGVIARDGKLLVTQRLEGTHLSGYWEFPGGKCEPGEAHESCLEREILEELNVASAVRSATIIPRSASRTSSRCVANGLERSTFGGRTRWHI